jgi:hypothetical protein
VETISRQAATRLYQASVSPNAFVILFDDECRRDGRRLGRGGKHGRARSYRPPCVEPLSEERAGPWGAFASLVPCQPSSYFFAFSPDLDHAAVGLGPPWETAADRIESATGSGWRHMRGG